ncbi:hypothetical protein DLJ59_07670 [Micromonospora inaquosa]|uniref:Uncharacterized protein n=1 Tax=Micromonospora inaquosa TaxID=2203716 RepID=A0A3N9WX81_9ACTN|nr:hypothetical protein DLJ59_07670 [Micromonospora inaquosa]
MRRPVLAVAAALAVLVAVVITLGRGLWTGSPQPQTPATAHPEHPTTRGDLFTQRQAVVNKGRFLSPVVAEFAAPWLGEVSDCIADTSTGGPQAGTGEQSRTRCAAGIVTTYWISYRTIADRDAAQARYAAQAANAPRLTPGATPPTTRSTSSHDAYYIEYAYKVPSGPQAGQSIAAIWWSDANKPIAGVFLAYWTEGLGSTWAPLRDLWSRAI